MRRSWRARKAPRQAGRVVMRRAASAEQADILAGAFRVVLADLMAVDDVRVDVEQRPRRDGFAVWVCLGRTGERHGRSRAPDDPGALVSPLEGP